MKKLLLSLVIILSFVSASGQSVLTRGQYMNTIQDDRLILRYNLVMPRFTDTSDALPYLGIDSAGATIYTYVGEKVWVRGHNPKRWIDISSSGAGVGTVTSVGSGFGILGGTITSSGTLRADTLNSGLTTWLRTKHVVDSLGALIPVISGYVPESRTISINNVVQDLSDNRAWTVGSVTSVATGFGLLGGTITTSGTLRTDTLNSGVTTWLRTKKVVDSLGTLITSGTVTNVASGYGILGGPITTTGTLRIDTLNTGLATWLLVKKKVDSLGTLIGGGSGSVTNVATGYGLSGGPITSTGTILVDSSSLSNYFLRRKDSSVNGGYYPYATNPKNYLTSVNLLVEANGDGVHVLYDENDTLKHKTLFGNTFIDVTDIDSTIHITLDTASAGLKTYIALYGNDGGGGGMDSLEVVAYDSLAVSNVWINSTLNRMGYRLDSFYYHLAITDSVRYINPAGGGGGYDADAITYFTAVEATGASISDTHKQAYSDWVTAEKAGGRYTKRLVIYPFMGGTEASHAINAKNPGTNDLTFTSGWTHSSLGSLSSGAASVHAETGVNLNTLSQNSNHMQLYINNNVAGVYDMGAEATAGLDIIGQFSNQFRALCFSSAVGSLGVISNATTSVGDYIISRTASTDYNMSKNGSVTNVVHASVTAGSRTIWIGDTNIGASSTGPSAHRYPFAAIGSGLTSSEMTAASADVITFLTATGRN